MNIHSKKQVEKQVEKQVGRLWEAREAPPQSIHKESKTKKAWGEASRASHSVPNLKYISK